MTFKKSSKHIKVYEMNCNLDKKVYVSFKIYSQYYFIIH